MKKVLLLAVSMLILSSCSEVQKIDNGQIPKEYINDIKPFLGDWAGSFHGHRGQLKLSLNETNQLLVSFYGEKSNDLIPGCDTSFGLLKEVELKDKDNKVRIYRATFDIDTNKCSRSILGQQINFSFNKAQTAASLSLLHRQWREYECRIVGHDPYGRPIRQCEHVTREIYLHGQFALIKN